MYPKYYLVQFDWEYLTNNDGDVTLLRTKAARLRRSDHGAMHDAMLREGVRGDLVPTSYKPAGTKFLDPSAWEYRHNTWRIVKGNRTTYFKRG
jgi:hypothetical protein